MTELYSLFDTVYVSFYKGLGAVTGAMLLGSTSYFQDHARIWLRRFGGNLFSHLPYYFLVYHVSSRTKMILFDDVIDLLK
jgi:threonine aldolase